MLTILLCWCLSLFHHEDIPPLIQALFTAKQEAVRTGDMKAYLNTIFPDKHYQQEQKHWFFDAITYIDPKSFRIQVEQITHLKPNVYQVKITQSYTREHRHYRYTYPVIVKKTSFGMKDADTFTDELKQGVMKVKYSDTNEIKQANQTLRMLKNISARLRDIYHWKPDVMEVKLYQDPALFRQSVKLSLPTWAGGWNEAKQAIKLVVGNTDTKSLYHGLAHEYTHQLVSSLTNDNAAYWLQEGAAMYYEAKITGEPPQFNHQFHPYKIKELEKLNLEQLPDDLASKYYLSCYAQFRQLVEQYGENKIGQVFLNLKKYPFVDKDSVMKQKETNFLTSKSLHFVGMLPKLKSEVWKVS